ncbi:MAG: transcriptional repressor LexA [Pseudohongiellaceae bacterium]|tara:strand:- start:295 stop:903 length:609 start_codon:yes stop_codon:yes gene_type:complete
MKDLTIRQQQILNYIKDHLSLTGFPPTRSDIANEMGFKSPNAAEDHLRALARKGAIEIVPGTSRGIRLPINEQLGLPIIGQVAAGFPILAEESISGYSEVPSNFFTPSADYLLTVKGSSMVEIGIYEDDLLAVHKTDQAISGDIIVARIEDEVTVKRFEFEKGSSTVKLIAENSDFAPIIVNLKDRDFSIEGISVGVIRRSM